MNIKKAYEIQAQNEITVRNGYTQKESITADNWTTRFGYLASILGWGHEIEEDADDESAVFVQLKDFAPTNFEYQNLTATYGVAGLVASNNTAVKMEG